MNDEKIKAPIKGRLLQFIEFQSIKKNEIFHKLGAAASNFRGKALQSEISAELIAKFLLHFPQCNPDWILMGRGQMIRDVFSENSGKELLEYHPTEIGKRIESIRYMYNLSLEDFINKLNIKNYDKIVAGKSNPTLQDCIAICTGFNISMDWLLFGKTQHTESHHPDPRNSVKATIGTNNFLLENNVLLREVIELKKKIQKIEKN